MGKKDKMGEETETEREGGRERAFFRYKAVDASLGYIRLFRKT